jgi:NAD(P)-dependent dehydrogenase (short-subunit alcohol dehydrogenase family)
MVPLVHGVLREHQSMTAIFRTVDYDKLSPLCSAELGHYARLTAELAPAIRVNAIAPSLTATPLAAGLTSNPLLATGFVALHAIPRLGAADELVPLAQLRLPVGLGWMTGEINGVDGGRSTLCVGKA